MRRAVWQKDEDVSEEVKEHSQTSCNESAENERLEADPKVRKEYDKSSRYSKDAEAIPKFNVEKANTVWTILN